MKQIRNKTLAAILAAVLTLSMVFAMSGCGNNSDNSKPTNTEV